MLRKDRCRKCNKFGIVSPESLCLTCQIDINTHRLMAQHAQSNIYAQVITEKEIKGTINNVITKKYF